MQKIYTDTSKLIEFNIELDGANINEAKARLVLEFPNKKNLLYYGVINNYDGKCAITVPPIKDINECEGNAFIEIIAESSKYFVAWSDTFKLEPKVKVMVEMIENEKPIIKEETFRPKISMISEEPKEVIKESKQLTNFKKFVSNSNMNFDYVLKNKTNFLNMLREYKNANDLDREQIMSIVNEIKNTENKKGNNSMLNS